MTPSRLPRARATNDHELVILGRIADLIAVLDADARRRVWAYLGARIDTLPVATEPVVGNGEDDDAPLFDLSDPRTQQQQ